MLKVLYNYIVKFYIKLWGVNMTFKAAVKLVLQEIINREIKKLTIEANSIQDLHRKTILNTEIIHLKELSDKLDESK